MKLIKHYFVHYYKNIINLSNLYFNVCEQLNIHCQKLENEEKRIFFTKKKS